jgi:hypothetical protein
MVVPVGHKGELAEKGQPVVTWLVQFQFVGLPHISVEGSVAHCKGEDIPLHLGVSLHIYFISPKKRRALFVYSFIFGNNFTEKKESPVSETLRHFRVTSQGHVIS